MEKIAKATKKEEVSLDLGPISKRLLELIGLINEAGKEYGRLQLLKDRKEAQLYMTADVAGMKNKEMRDAYVHQALDLEGMLEPLTAARGIYSKLNLEKDLLIEISSNLRTIMAGEARISMRTLNDRK
jgi:hypothetical protein